MATPQNATPGPWFPATGWVGRGDLPNAQVICRIDGYPYGPTEANTCLIAAAPEMLEALKTIESCLSPEDNDYAARKVRAAIAKAERRP